MSRGIKAAMATAVAGVCMVGSAALTVPATGTPATVAVAGPLVAVDRGRLVGLRAVDTETYSASPVDYDRDGRQDVWIGYHGFGGKLWHNRGRRPYGRVARDAWPSSNGPGLHVDRHDCDWADVDGNGLPDAYCSTGRMIRHVVKTGRGNELWLQTRPGRFREVGGAWGVADVCGRGRDVAFLNVNGDRWPDLFLGNEAPRTDHPEDPCDSPDSNLPNELGKVYINVRGHDFRHVRRLWNFGGGIGIRCAEVLDFDRDGWDDLLTCGKPRSPLHLYRNRHGRGFADVTARQQLGTEVSDAVVVDWGRDGDKDVVTATPTGFALHLNEGGQFGPAVPVGSPAVGEGWSVAVADADGDSDLDVYGMVFGSFTTNPNDGIWINTGSGFRSTPVAVPHAVGSADQVVALTKRAGHRAAFLAMNGYGRFERGPVQYIQLTRRTP
jgi:hypothetical protein